MSRIMDEIRQEGYREGLREFRREYRRGVAQRLLQFGKLSLEEIAYAVALPVDEVKALLAGK